MRNNKENKEKKKCSARARYVFLSIAEAKTLGFIDV